MPAPTSSVNLAELPPVPPTTAPVRAEASQPAQVNEQSSAQGPQVEQQAISIQQAEQQTPADIQGGPHQRVIDGNPITGAQDLADALAPQQDLTPEPALQPEAAAPTLPEEPVAEAMAPENIPAVRATDQTTTITQEPSAQPGRTPVSSAEKQNTPSSEAAPKTPEQEALEAKYWQAWDKYKKAETWQERTQLFQEMQGYEQQWPQLGKDFHDFLKARNKQLGVLVHDLNSNASKEEWYSPKVQEQLTELMSDTNAPHPLPPELYQAAEEALAIKMVQSQPEYAQMMIGLLPDKLLEQIRQAGFDLGDMTQLKRYVDANSTYLTGLLDEYKDRIFQLYFDMVYPVLSK